MIGLQELDRTILFWIQEHLRIEFLTPFWRAVTFLGDGGWFWITLSLLFLCFKKTRQTGITSLLSLSIGFLLTNLCLKNMIARPRPFDVYTEILPLIERPTDFSFPSGHTCVSFACALICVRMLPKKFGVCAVILACMIAFSRLYLGVHYPGDVLGGFLAGLTASILAHYLMFRYEEIREKQKAGLPHIWKHGGR